MPVQRPDTEYMEHVVAGMRETLKARATEAPDPVNLDAAASLFDPIPLLWAGVEYPVRTISYRDGLKLQKLTLSFDRIQKQSADGGTDIEAHERLLDETLALFWSFLDPKPRSNPFETATPLEVGALAGFFFTCQRTQNHPSWMQAVRLSRSIT